MLWHSLKNRNSELKQKPRRRKIGEWPGSRKRRKSGNKSKLQQSWRNKHPQKRGNRRLNPLLTVNRLKTTRTRIPPPPLRRMRHICKMILFLATLMKLMMTLHCNWSKNWNQMKTQCSQVIGRSKKPIPEIQKENHK